MFLVLGNIGIQGVVKRRGGFIKIDSVIREEKNRRDCCFRRREEKIL